MTAQKKAKVMKILLTEKIVTNIKKVVYVKLMKKKVKILKPNR